MNRDILMLFVLHSLIGKLNVRNVADSSAITQHLLKIRILLFTMVQIPRPGKKLLALMHASSDIHSVHRPYSMLAERVCKDTGVILAIGPF